MECETLLTKTSHVRIKERIRRVRVTCIAVVFHVLCVSVALVTQHAIYVRRIILSVACPTLPYFSTSSQKRHDFQKKKYRHKMLVLIFSATSVSHSSHSTKDSAEILS
jgi:hypothetical protein